VYQGDRLADAGVISGDRKMLPHSYRIRTS
jgi:hypothetical protein